MFPDEPLVFSVTHLVFHVSAGILAFLAPLPPCPLQPLSNTNDATDALVTYLPAGGYLSLSLLRLLSDAYLTLLFIVDIASRSRPACVSLLRRYVHTRTLSLPSSAQPMAYGIGATK